MVVVGVDVGFGGLGVGEEAGGVVVFGIALSLVLDGESAVVFGFDDAVVEHAQELSVADAGDAATGAGFDVMDVAFRGGFVASGGVLAVAVS